jgi:hypothetical protein
MRLQIKDSTILMKKPFQIVNRATNFLRDTQVMKFIEWQNQKIIFQLPSYITILAICINP